MATTKLILQQPYKTPAAKDKAQHPQNGESAGNGTKRAKTLNPRETRLYLFLIIDRKHVIKIKTEHTILPREWDFKKQGKKEILAGSLEFNSGLQELKSDIKSKYDKLIKEIPDLSFEALTKALQEYGKTKEIPMLEYNKDFFQIMDEFISSMEGENTPGTIKKFKTLKKSLQEFGLSNPKYKILSFSMIDHIFKDAYTKYLRNQKPRGRQKSRPEGFQTGLLNDTIGKYIECLKTFCKWSEERGYNRYSVYSQFTNFTKANKKRTKKGHDIVTLSLPELKQLYEFDFSNKPTLDHVRDLFCFGAYTGQRWSDIERFSKDQIRGDVWTFNAYKTKKETEIDLIGYAAPALDVLRKYDFELPKISLQKFNVYIKDAVREAGIIAPIKIMRFVGAKEIEIAKPKYEFIGSHTARKTCVSLLLNVYNVPITNVLEITGHNEIKTLQKYVNKDRAARREAMRKTVPVTETMKVKRNAV